MPAILLYPYTVRIRQLWQHDPLSIDQFTDGQDLFDIVNGYLEEILDDCSTIPALRKVVIVKELAAENRNLHGLLHTGHYGFETDIVDINTGDTSYEKQIDDADLTPFFFHFYLPANTTRGFLVIQKLGQHGIREVLRHVVENKFREVSCPGNWPRGSEKSPPIWTTSKSQEKRGEYFELYQLFRSDLQD